MSNVRIIGINNKRKQRSTKYMQSIKILIGCEGWITGILLSINLLVNMLQILDFKHFSIQF